MYHRFNYYQAQIKGDGIWQSYCRSRNETIKYQVIIPCPKQQYIN